MKYYYTINKLPESEVYQAYVLITDSKGKRVKDKAFSASSYTDGRNMALDAIACQKAVDNKTSQGANLVEVKL